MNISMNAQADLPSIMLVDDVPENLRVLFEMLKERGYKSRPVSSGPLAIEAAMRQPPDLILLDIKMPEMDGYDVCKRLKADAKLKHIPVVFISALGEMENKLKAFECGGVDYITKPFQHEEVLARVKTHLHSRKSYFNLGRQITRGRRRERLNRRAAAIPGGGTDPLLSRGEFRNDRAASPQITTLSSLGFDPEAPTPQPRDRGLLDRYITAGMLGDFVSCAAAPVTMLCASFIPWFGITEAALLSILQFSATSALCLLLTNTYCGVYHSTNLVHRPKADLLTGRAATISTVVLLALLAFHELPEVPLPYALAGILAQAAAFVCWRLRFARHCVSESVADKLKKRCIIIGWRQEAERLLDSDGQEFTVVGHVSIPGCEAPPAAVKSISALENLKCTICTYHVDIVIVADTSISSDALVEMSHVCAAEMVELKFIPAYIPFLESGLRVRRIKGVPVLGIGGLALSSPVNCFLKRIVDVVGALVGLVLSAPALAVFSVLIYLESPGPVIYRQTRMGRKGAHFEILKLRSMRLDAEAPGKVGWSTMNDPRRLRVGAFMRRWNIDELPQFLNVLKGEMSLVGPRPERPEIIHQLKYKIPYYNARHLAKPGITGWAQVHGLRGDTDLVARAQYDLFYMENWSLYLDLLTMLRTVVSDKRGC